MLITPPPGDYRAYLFDCDGTVADSMPLHFQAWQQALDEWGCEFPEDLFYAWGGRPVADIVPRRRRSERLPTEQLLGELAAISELAEKLEVVSTAEDFDVGLTTDDMLA